jgi:hypothetical protein
MAPHDHTVDVLEACRTDLHVLTAETAPCGGIRAVVQYLASLGKRALGVGRATVTMEQLDVRRWATREPMATARREPPFGWCHNPLLLRFYHDPDVWTLSFNKGDESGPDDARAFVSDDSPPHAFIRDHDATTALREAVRWRPRDAAELFKSRHRRLQSSIPGYITMGGADEAYAYWQHNGQFWGETEGALPWVAQMVRMVSRHRGRKRGCA